MRKKLNPKNSNLKLDIVSAGTWFGDGGAAFGNLPRDLWKKYYPPASNNQIPFELNCLLIRDSQNTILVDSGFGNKQISRLTQLRISAFCLLENLQKLGVSPAEIDYVVLSHLHNDHAGGLVSWENNQASLNFPAARYLIQEAEWQSAKYPSQLQASAYDFQSNLSLIESSGKLQLISGDYEISDEISLQLVGGHTAGMQVLKISKDNFLLYYAADLFPTRLHRHPSIIPAADIYREESYNAKQRILQELREKRGTLILSHEPEAAILHF
ncbi:MAG: MBL fold metallo-hydrolase [Candidatus Cloacimonadales bacterium]